MDLLLKESFDTELVEANAGDGYFNADGTVNMVLIRPCNGKGHGSRIYEADMLERDHQRFARLAMFDNHDSEAALRARGGNPRPPSDIRGGVLETWWEPNFITPRDAENGFGKGAVIGKCRLVESMNELVRVVPHLLKTSINAHATALKPGSRNGKRGMIVEGIAVDATSSVDLVTAAGAGGELAELREALGLSDGGTSKTPCNGDVDDPADPAHGAGMTLTEAEIKALVAAQVKEHVPTALTEALPAALTDALTSDAVTTALTEAAVTANEQSRASLVEQLTAPDEVRSLADLAVRLIEAEKLPSAAAKAKMLADFGAEGIGQRIVAGPRLALIEADVDADGKVVKSAEDLLKEAIEAEAKVHRQILSEARPTTPSSWATAGAAFTAPGSTTQTGDSAGELIEAPAIVGILAGAGVKSDYLIEKPEPTKTAADAA